MRDIYLKGGSLRAGRETHVEGRDDLVRPLPSCPGYDDALGR